MVYEPKSTCHDDPGDQMDRSLQSLFSLMAPCLMECGTGLFFSKDPLDIGGFSSFEEGFVEIN